MVVSRSFHTVSSHYIALLQKEAKWKWKETKNAFENAKDLLISTNLLVHYCEPLVLACDATPCGLGVVM